MIVTRGLGGQCALVTGGLGVWRIAFIPGWRDTVRFSVFIQRRVQYALDR